MNSILVALGVFAVCLAMGLVGLALYPRIRAAGIIRHGNKDVVRLIQGLVATMSALVLSLLIASASSRHHAQAEGLTAFAANMVVLDGALSHLGPAAAEARAGLRAVLAARIAANEQPGAALMVAMNGERVAALYGAIVAIEPTTPVQRIAHERVIAISGSLAQAHAALVVRDLTSDVQWPFLAVLTAWLAALFLGIGLFARSGPLVICAIFAGALAVGGAMFLILELEQTHVGLLRISDAPLRLALAQMAPAR